MKNKGFSLIELLIVIVLIGIVYGIYFFTVVESKKSVPFAISNMKLYLYNASKTHGEKLALIYNYDEKEVYLLNDNNKLLETIPFNQIITQYILKQNEVLELSYHKSVEVGDNYFTPTFIYKKVSKDVYSDLILNDDKNNWYYFNTYFGDDYNTFVNETDMINFIKKKDYLPMYAGKPE